MTAENGPSGVIFPESMPTVQLVNVSPAQLEAVLESSTIEGKEVARRVRADELQLTLAAEGVTARAVGLATPTEVHVQWTGAVQDVAATLIHEATHQADPGLVSALRSGAEATARLAEFDYGASKDLPPSLGTETSSKASTAVCSSGPLRRGLPPHEAKPLARAAIVDMMNADATRYGVEPGAGGQGAGCIVPRFPHRPSSFSWRRSPVTTPNCGPAK